MYPFGAASDQTNAYIKIPIKKTIMMASSGERRSTELKTIIHNLESAANNLGSGN